MAETFITKWCFGNPNYVLRTLACLIPGIIAMMSAQKLTHVQAEKYGTGPMDLKISKSRLQPPRVSGSLFVLQNSVLMDTFNLKLAIFYSPITVGMLTVLI